MNRFLITPETWREIIEKVGTKYEDGTIELTKIDPFQKEDGDKNIEDFFAIVLSDFWNSSVQDLYDNWEKFFGEGPDSISEKVKNFASGDAGYDFDQHFIKPWQNTPADQYTPDSLSAAKDNENLQFTNEQESENSYRLLMPKNTRRVQAEDLTRNFWVISSVLSSMIEFLFSPQSPILVLQRGITNEIKELWENVLFLWFSFKLLNEPRVSENYHIEFVPVDGKINEERRRYDAYDSLNDDAINNKLKEYFYKYPESNLLLIPYTRSKPFYRNYHESIQIPYLCFYLRKKDPFSQDWGDGNCKIIKRFKKDLKIDVKDYIDKLVAIRENGMSVRLGRPLSSIPELRETEERLYYGQIRVVPTIEQIIDEETNKSTFNFTFSVYDVGEFYHLGGDEINTQDNLLDEITFSCEEEQTEDIEWTGNPVNKDSFSFFNYPRRNLDAYKGENLTTIKHSIKKVSYVAGEITNIQMKGDLFRIGNFFSSDAIGAKGSENSYVFREQVNSSKTHTNYLTNLSMGYLKNAGGENPVNALGNVFGTPLGNPWKPSQCSFYTPVARDKITSDSWTWGGEAGQYTEFYWGCKQNSEDVESMDNYWDQVLNANAKEKNIYSKNEVTKEHLKYMGIITLRRLLNHTAYLNYLRQGHQLIDWNLTDPITFIGAYGVQPWGGGNAAASENGRQIYWESVVLQGLYLYVPKDLDDKIDNAYKEKYNIRAEFKQGEDIKGYIYFLREINKSEINFGGSTYFVERDGSRWRLVKNIGQQEAGVYYLKVYEEDGVTFKGIVELTSAEYQDYTEQEDKDAFITTIINQETGRILEEEYIIQKLVQEVFSNCNGIWRVYDGQSNNTTGNKSNYLGYRQVVDSRYDSVDDNLNLKAIQIRKKNDTEWYPVPSSELPDYQDLIWSSEGILTGDDYKDNEWS